MAITLPSSASFVLPHLGRGRVDADGRQGQQRQQQQLHIFVPKKSNLSVQKQGAKGSRNQRDLVDIGKNVLEEQIIWPRYFLGKSRNLAFGSSKDKRRFLGKTQNEIWKSHKWQLQFHIARDYLFFDGIQKKWIWWCIPKKFFSIFFVFHAWVHEI